MSKRGKRSTETLRSGLSGKKTEVTIAKLVVGSDAADCDGIDFAIAHPMASVVPDERQVPVFDKIHENWQSFFSDPSDFLINLSCAKRNSFRLNFQKGDSKQELLNKLEEFLSASAFRRVRSELLLIGDELFTNFEKSALTKDGMDFFVDSDKDRVLIGCRDAFGTLDPKIMLKNIQRCYRFGVKNSICTDKDLGAGIGSYLMYSLSDGMAVITESQVRCMVLFWMSKRTRRDEDGDLKKGLIVVKKEKANGTND